MLQTAADRIRRHSLEITDEAGSGHPTSSMSCADLMSALFFGHMRIHTDNPHNRHNDRFVLSKGHAAPALWSVYYEAGLIDRDALHSLRKIDSRQEGHPTPRQEWVDVATGSLGQGLSMGLGMAWAAQHLQTDSHTYVLLGDGETAEGSVWEAAALAAHLSLDTLTAIVDINTYGQSETTMLGDDAGAYADRFRAFGWQTITIDGHDIQAINDALHTAKTDSRRPTAILAQTIKGKGFPEIEGAHGSHGKPAPSLQAALDALGDDAKDRSRERELAVQAPARNEDFPQIQFDGVLPKPDDAKEEAIATRTAFGTAMVDLGKICQQLVAVDGDVKNSTKLQGFFDHYPERSIEGYIAEQNMLGMATGLSASGLLPCTATFAAFFTRAFDQLRIAAISRSRMMLAGSHAGVAIGQDGPTQMGLEDIAMMRTLPGSIVLYPADATSARAAVTAAAHHEGIAYLRLNRGKTPVMYGHEECFEPGGSKVWYASNDDQATLVGAGVTLFECLKAQKALADEGISVRVVDGYSVKPIDRDTLTRCAKETGAVIVVEDHYPQGGLGEATFAALSGMDIYTDHLAVAHISRSGPPDALLDRHGISSQHIRKAVEKALRSLEPTNTNTSSV